MPDGAVVAGRISFAEVVALDMGEVSAEDLPVNFIQIVALQDDAADDAGAGSGAHPDFNFATKEVVFGLDGGGVAARGDGEVGAGGLGVFQGAGSGVPGGANGGDGEVIGVVRRKSKIGGTIGGVERIA